MEKPAKEKLEYQKIQKAPPVTMRQRYINCALWCTVIMGFAWGSYLLTPVARDQARRKRKINSYHNFCFSFFKNFSHFSYIEEWLEAQKAEEEGNKNTVDDQVEFGLSSQKNAFNFSKVLIKNQLFLILILFIYKTAEYE